MMIQVPISQMGDQLSSLLAKAAGDDVVLTSDGRPVAVLIGFATEEDWADYQLESDSRFEKRIEKARAEIAAGQVVRLEDLKK